MKATDFICGLFAGWTQVLVGQPLDFIKIKIQTTQSKTVSTIEMAKDIYRSYGLKGFYRGSSSLLFGFAFTIGTQFLVYEWAKRWIFNNIGNRTGFFNPNDLSLWEIGASGGAVGLATSFIYCPIQYTKIQRQISGNIKESSLSLLFKEIAQNGVKNIYRGYWMTLLRQFYGSCCYYATYEGTVRSYTKDNRQKADYLVFLKAGAMAGLCYHLFTYPADTLKSNIQAGMKWRQALSNSFQFSKLEGYKVVLVRAAIVNACSFAVYQKMQEYVRFFDNYSYGMW